MMKRGDAVSETFLVGFSAWSSLHGFDAVSRLTGRTCGLYCSRLCLYILTGAPAPTWNNP